MKNTKKEKIRKQLDNDPIRRAIVVIGFLKIAAFVIRKADHEIERKMFAPPDVKEPELRAIHQDYGSWYISLLTVGIANIVRLISIVHPGIILETELAINMITAGLGSWA